MAKLLNKWLDEFVDNGANPSDVTDWPENAGGGGSSIEEGTGIKITGKNTKTISIDEEVVAKKEDIGNGTITITQGGTTKGTFDLNQGANQTIDLDAGGGTSVIANPTLVGDEPNLTSIGINGAKFKIPNGSSSGDFTRYVHTILVRKTTMTPGVGGGYPAAVFSFSLILRSNELIDSYAKLKAYLISTIVEGSTSSPYIPIVGSLYREANDETNGKHELFAMCYDNFDGEIFLSYTILSTVNGQQVLGSVEDWLAHDATLRDYVYEL